MDKLSSISLLSEQLGLDSQLPTVPFSADLETQHGTKITCLPFKTMPFSILEAAESLRPDQCVLNETLRIVHPLKIRPNLLCAYPVLIPLYLAQYSTENGNQTAVLEAYNDSGRIIVENVESPILTEYAGEIPADLTKSWLFQKIVPRPMWDSSDFMYHRGFETPFINLAYISIPESWDKSAAESFRKFEHWLRPFTGLQQLVQPGASEMSDPRIRPFIKEEVEGVRNWIEIGEEHTRVRNTSLRKNASEEDLKALKDYTASLKIRREKALPSWWKDWQKSVGVSVAANVRRDERPVDAGAAIENAKDEKQR
ncbi:hypothetical protein DFH09DRAFT_285384 [Mycena vulgaris]|nr:hypothetical protein DFH09DRAFT_285384 [Mycena vulgaris]